MSSPDLQETYFNLKTLTLRDRLESGACDTRNSISSSQQRIVTQSPNLTSQNYLLQVKLLLLKHWRWLAAFLVGASYVIFIVALHSYNYQLISTNTQLIKLQSSMTTSNLMTSSRVDMSSSRYKTSSGDLAEKSSVKVITKPDADSSRLKSLLLSLSSQQSQISNLRKSLEDTQQQVHRLKILLERSSTSSQVVLDSLLRETNLTLCTEAGKKLLAPLEAVYRIHFSAKVHGNTYINRKMFEISKNGEKLRNGGVLRIRYNGTENKSVDCGVREKNTCFNMEEALLVKLKVQDYVRVDDLFSKEGGRVYDLKFCMTITDIDKIPGDEESLLITH